MGIKLVGLIMKKAFSLIELLIVVAVIGILAAIVIPEFQTYTQQAKEAVAKDNLRILRNAIELYATQHNGIPPGYPSGDPLSLPLMAAFRVQIVGGNYLNDLPENPFNNTEIFRMIPNHESLPANATGEYGWIYKPQTKTIKLDWPGTDSEGVRYFDY